MIESTARRTPDDGMKRLQVGVEWNIAAEDRERGPAPDGPGLGKCAADSSLVQAKAANGNRQQGRSLEPPADPHPARLASAGRPAMLELNRADRRIDPE